LKAKRCNKDEASETTLSEMTLLFCASSQSNVCFVAGCLATATIYDIHLNAQRAARANGWEMFLVVANGRPNVRRLAGRLRKTTVQPNPTHLDRFFFPDVGPEFYRYT